MPFPVLGSNSAVAGYEIDNSLRFNDGDSQYIYRTPSAETNKQTWTWSAWFKRSDVTTSQNLWTAGNDVNNRCHLDINADGTFQVEAKNGGISVMKCEGGRVLRDPSAWMHLVWRIDTTQGTDSNRMRIYLNGEQFTFSSNSYPSQNTNLEINVNSVLHAIGKRTWADSNYFDGYLAEVHFVDGQSYAPTVFGETNDNGVWIPKDCKDDITYGTNGYFLEFKQTGTSANASGIGADTSGNDNHFSVSGFSAIDITTDTPTNNFATMNSVHVSSHGSSTLPTFSEGNLKIAMSDGSSTSSSIAPSSGKWYVEYKQSENTADNQGYPIVGISATLGGTAGDIIGFRTPSGTNYRGQLGTSSIDNAFLSARQAGDIFGFYIDLDNSTLIIHKNGSTYMNTGYTGGLDWSGGLTTTNSQTGFFHFYVQSNTANAFTDEVNFGNPSFSISSGNADANGFGNFEYSPTLSGTNYYALCTKNLAEYG